MLSSDFIEQVRSRNDIVEVVGEYVQLNQKGANFWGLCPFHQEKTPSFTVHAGRQGFHCFGCHIGGDVFRFIQHIERVEFLDSVKILAQRVHLEMPDAPAQAENAATKERLFQANRLAALFFHEQLYQPVGRQALEYLYQRGIQDAVIRRFGLGYAPGGWTALLDELISKGYSQQELSDIGLAVNRDKHCYDAFRDRVMFPIIHTRGNVIGFGGRVLGKSQPKYLNSPDSPIFNKRFHLYGLNQVKREAQPRPLIIVEGYMDVISLHQHGIPFAVASLGTALTPEQVKLIRRHSQSAFIAYDGDAAGQRATLRGLDLLEQGGCRVHVITFPDGLDPDDFIRQKGIRAFEQAQKEAYALPVYKMRTLAKQYDLASEQGKSDYAVACAKVLSQVGNPVEQETHLKRLQIETGFSMQSLREQVLRSKGDAFEPKPERYKSGNLRNDNDSASQLDRAQKQLVALALRNGHIADQLSAVLTPDIFPHRAYRLIAEAIQRERAGGVRITLESLNQEAQEDLSSAYTEVMCMELADMDEQKLFFDCIRILRGDAMERRIRNLQQQLPDPQHDRRRWSEMMRELQALNAEYEALKRQEP